LHRSIAIVVVWVVVLGGANEATASTLSLAPSNTTCTTNINTNLSGSALYGILDTCFDVTATSLDLLYKENVSGVEDGTYSSSYDTTFSNSNQNALIVYLTGTAINCTECYLVVKDGNNQPAQYFFDLSAFGWNGTDSISLTNFWPSNGSISNVAIWGVASVPEPTTLLLTGLGLAVASMVRRRKVCA